MADQYMTSLIDPMRNLSFDSNNLLTTSTINALHFPGLSTSGMSDGGSASRRTSFLLDGLSMCESMTESYSSATGQDESNVNHQVLIERKDSTTTTKKRRSRKSQFDASTDSPSLDKIESVNLVDEQNEADDAWLYQPPIPTMKNDPNTDNIFSWVHKEFQSNDINASKHRLLCKLDDMSHARTIRSVSCHNFLDTQRMETFKRSSTDQQVHSEPLRNGHLSSPLRNTNPIFPDQNALSPLSLGPLMSTTNQSNVALSKSRDVSKEREKTSMDYTDLEVMAKVQLENLRQAERQAPLSKRFGGSNVSLSSNSSGGTTVSNGNRSGNKPPVAPKPTVTTTTTRNPLSSNPLHRSNPTQAVLRNSQERPGLVSSQSANGLSSRTSITQTNSTNINNRTRPPISRPIQTYRGSQTTFQSSSRLSTVPSSAPRTGKKLSQDFTSSTTVGQNGLLHDVSNKPLTGPIRSQAGPQRSSMHPSNGSNSAVNGSAPTLTRSSSSLSQGRKSNIPMVGKPQRPSTATVTRSTTPNVSATTKKLLNQRTVPPVQRSSAAHVPPWNDGCY